MINNKIRLLKEVTTFELLFEENLKFFKEISMYIIAGEQKWTFKQLMI